MRERGRVWHEFNPSFHRQESDLFAALPPATSEAEAPIPVQVVQRLSGLMWHIPCMLQPFRCSVCQATKCRYNHNHTVPSKC